MKKFLFYLICGTTLATRLLSQEKIHSDTMPVSPATLTLFITTADQPSSATTEKASVEKAERTITTPGKFTHTLVKEDLKRPVVGLWAAYGGMCTHSDYEGQITFPRRHIGETIDLVITQKIKPIILSGNTVVGFVVAENAPCAYYTIQRIQTNDIFYWETKEVAQPSARQIPPFALILFAKPREIMMNFDLIITNGSPNILLPPIILAPGSSLAINTLLFFKVNRYFAPVARSYKATDDRFATLLIA